MSDPAPSVTRAIPDAPDVMSADEISEARHHALTLVRMVRESKGSRQLDALDSVGHVGVVTQRNAGRQLELVQTRIASLIDDGGAAKSVTGDLAGLRTALNQIDPHRAEGTFGRTFGRLPVMRNRTFRHTLTRIALRYETVSQQVTTIESRLRAGRDMLTRDNVELRQLYEDVEAQQDVVSRQAFLAELLRTELEALLADTDDRAQRTRVQSALSDVTIRVQDLYTMQEVHNQFFVSIELTRHNNVQLGQAVDRTLAMATRVVTVGLAIQAALVRQRRVQEATERTRQFLGTMVENNAQAIRRQSEEIGDLYNEPVIALEQLTRAHADLLAALDVAGRVREQGLAAGRRNIEQLHALTEEMAEHVEGLAEQTGGGR